jgi:hypothetical protein
MKLTTRLYLVQRSKNTLSYTSTLTIRLHGVVLSLKKKAQGHLYLYLTFVNTILYSVNYSVGLWRFCDI